MQLAEKRLPQSKRTLVVLPAIVSKELMNRFSLALSLLFASVSLHGQAAMPVELAAVEPVTQPVAAVRMPSANVVDTGIPPFGAGTSDVALAESSSSLPDAPEPVSAGASAPVAFDAQALGGTVPGTAPKFAFIILPGQQAVPLHGMEKAVYGLHDAFNPLQLVGITLSAGWSHLIDSQPHYGHNSEAFGKRVGAAALRSTVQTMATDAVFSPMFHDDPRYYALGRDHAFVNRVFYAATRVVWVRSSYSMKNRINAPLLLGYGSAAGLNNLYYPDQDTGAKNTFENWGTSLAGAALGFEVDEFLDDALRIVHLRK